MVKRGAARRVASEGTRRRRWGRWVVAAAGLVVVVVGVMAVLVFLDGRRAEASLRSAVPTVRTLQDSLLAGDTGAAQSALAELKGQTASAVAATRGPHWWLAAHVPGVGESVAAVQTVVGIVDTLTTDVLTPLADVAGAIKPSALLPHDGQINTRPLIEAAPRVIAADDAVKAARVRLSDIDEKRLIPQVVGAVTELKGLVDRLDGMTDLASKATRLVPGMLGALGQRQYVLVAQNPAEIRAGGGHIGAAMLVTADAGRITLGDRINGDLLESDTPALPLTDDERLLFTDRLAIYGQSATMTPDFPRAAEIVRAQWKRAFGQEVDGVVSLDPVALGYLLEAIGPVRMPDGSSLDSSNAAQALLNDIYKNRRVSDQDKYFGDAAKEVFARVMAGTPDVSAGVRALTRAANEGRWLVWSSDPAEQAVLADTPLSGALLGERDGSPVVGVFLNDTSVTKMSYYLDYKVRVERTACRPDGARRLTVTVDIASTAPPEAAGYPPYLSGDGTLAPGHSRTNVMVYSPARGVIDNVTVDGADYADMGLYSFGSMDVAQASIELGPGESHRLVVEMETAREGQERTAQLRVTPGSRPAGQGVVDPTC